MSWLSRFFDIFRFEPIPEPDLSPEDPTEPEVLSELGSLLMAHQVYRAQKGLRTVVADSRLDRAAQGHAEWMAANRRMSHYGAGRSSFDDRIRDEGFPMAAGGENVAAGYPTWKAVFEGWKGSAGHRRNMLRDSWTRVGLGVASDRNGKRYWCVVFAVPQSASTKWESVPRPLTLDCLPEPLEASAA